MESCRAVDQNAKEALIEERKTKGIRILRTSLMKRIFSSSGGAPLPTSGRCLVNGTQVEAQLMMTIRSSGYTMDHRVCMIELVICHTGNVGRPIDCMLCTIDRSLYTISCGVVPIDASL